MVPGVGRDLVALLVDALDDVGVLGDLVADLEERGLGAVVLEDVQDLGGGVGPGAVVEGEGDGLLVAGVDGVDRVAGVLGLLGDLGRGLAGDLAGADLLLAGLTVGVHVDRARPVVLVGAACHGGLDGPLLGGVLLLDVGTVGNLDLGATREVCLGVGDLLFADGGGELGATTLLQDATVDGHEVAGLGRGPAAVDGVLHGGEPVAHVADVVDADAVQRRVDHADDDRDDEKCHDDGAGEPAAARATATRGLMGAGTATVGNARGGLEADRPAGGLGVGRLRAGDVALRVRLAARVARGGARLGRVGYGRGAGGAGGSVEQRPGAGVARLGARGGSVVASMGSGRAGVAAAVVLGHGTPLSVVPSRHARHSLAGTRGVAGRLVSRSGLVGTSRHAEHGCP